MSDQEDKSCFSYTVPVALIEDSPSKNIGILYGIIYSLCNKKGYCWASNEYLAKKLRVSKRSISDYLSYLAKTSWILRDINQTKGNQRKIFVRKQAAIPIATDCYTYGSPLPDPIAADCHTPSIEDVVYEKKQPSNISISNINKNKNIVTNPKPRVSQHRAEPLRYSIDDKKFLGIKDEDMARWKVIYPSIDLTKEIAKAEEWCQSNPTKTKLKKNWRRYLTGWLQRTEERECNKQAYRTNQNKPNIQQIKDIKFTKFN